MKDDKQILDDFQKRKNQAFEASRWWRANEVKDGFGVYDGSGQWVAGRDQSAGNFPCDLDRQRQADMPIITVNKTAPVVDSVTGFQIQNRATVNYVPRLPDDSQKGFSDLVQNTARYIVADSQADFEDSQAFNDMCICGIGAVDHIISYDDNPDGETQIARIFPGFLLWDPGARKKNLKDANWLASARIIDLSTLEKEDGQEDYGSTGLEPDLVQFFSNAIMTNNLAVEYTYQWRVKTPFYRLKNPLYLTSDATDEERLRVTQLTQQVKAMPEIVTYLEAFESRFKISLKDDSIINLDPKDHREVKKEFEVFGIPFKATRQEKFRYYRATVIGNKVVSKDDNFSQKGFSLKLMTGKFSEIQQCFYGIVRAAKDPQRMLNQSVSDLQGFLQTIPKGGVIIEEDAVSDLQQFLNTYARAREVTIVKAGAINSNKILPKTTPALPSGLPDMIAYSGAATMETSGVTPDFMGISDNFEVSGVLQAQRVRQGLTVLAPYFDAFRFFQKDQSLLLIDCIRIMAENSPGRLIRNVSGKDSAKYFPLLSDGIAQEYDIDIEAVPQTPSERQDTFEKLVAMAEKVGNPQAFEFALPYSPLKKEDVEKFTAILQPPPPQEPDPLQVALIQAQTAELIAKAESYKAQSQQKNMEVLKDQKEIQIFDERQQAEIAQIVSSALLNRSKAAQGLNQGANQ